MTLNSLCRSARPHLREALPIRRHALVSCNRIISTSALRRNLEQTSLGPVPDEFPITTTPISQSQPEEEIGLDASSNKPDTVTKRRRLNAQPSTNHTRTAGTVVGAGNMAKTVKVLFVRQHWNRYLRKYFRVPYNLLAHDENSSIIEGDVVTIRPERYSRHVAHAIESIVAPFERNVDERPPLYTRSEYLYDHAEERRMKHERKIERLGQSVVAGKTGEKKFVDDGSAKGLDGKGREVMQGGKHRFGGINEEAVAGKRKAKKMQDQAVQNQAELAEQVDTEGDAPIVVGERSRVRSKRSQRTTQGLRADLESDKGREQVGEEKTAERQRDALGIEQEGKR